MRRPRPGGCASRFAKWHAAWPGTACRGARHERFARPIEQALPASAGAVRRTTGAQMIGPPRLAIHGDILDFTGEPAWGDTESSAVRFRPAHWLLVEQGRVAGVQAEPPGEGWQRCDHGGRLVVPGFIDTHVHSPQIDVMASYGTELLEWLTTHTFPAEARHADPVHAGATAALFLDALVGHGTTSALVFPTVHKASVDALFAAAEARGMRLIAGKVLMDRNAPDGLRDDVATAEREMEDLIARWHGRARLAYAVTVRFAPTSSREQLALAGRARPC